jgi:hypothetical protein
VKEQVTEVISGTTSQVDAILYTDFDELEGWLWLHIFKL